MARDSKGFLLLSIETTFCSLVSLSYNSFIFVWNNYSTTSTSVVHGGSKSSRFDQLSSWFSTSCKDSLIKCLHCKPTEVYELEVVLFFSAHP
jgi:hypothetical protein